MSANESRRIYMNPNHMNDHHYHRSPRIGRSGLQLFARSPRHYWAEYLDPNRVWKEPTKAMRIGTALHSAVLEPETVKEKIAIEPDRWPTKAECGVSIEQQKLEFYQQNRRKTILTSTEQSLVKSMYTAVMSHPVAVELLGRRGEIEKVGLFDHPLTGSPSKIKPDKYILDENLVIDLKTTDDASAGSFAKSCVNYWYHVQSAWYLDGLHAINGVMPRGFVFIAVEKEPPYAVAIYYAPPEMIELGRKIYQRHLVAYEKCRQADDWPGYPEEFQPINLPFWAYKQEEHYE